MWNPETNKELPIVGRHGNATSARGPVRLAPWVAYWCLLREQRRGWPGRAWWQVDKSSLSPGLGFPPWREASAVSLCSWPLSPLCNDLLSDVGSSLLSAGAKGLGSSWPVATPPQRSLLPSLLSGVSFRLSLCSFSYPSPLAPEECRFSSRTLPGLTLPPVSLPGE